VNNQAGNRFDDEPDQVHLKSGTVIHGKIKSEVEFYRPNAYRTGDNMVVTPESEYGPNGSVLIKLEGDTEKDIKSADIAEVRRAQQPGSSTMAGGAAVDTIVMKDGTEHVGKLDTKVSFAGAERLEDGTMVVKNTEANPILGDLKMDDTKGVAKRIPISDINYMVREDENEVLADEALAYIIRNRGVFCADSWTHSSVNNGTRTIDALDRWKPGDPDQPSWVRTNDTKGYRGEIQNPDNVMYFSAGKSNYGGMKFWIEVDDNNMPINSKIFSGQWDFLWGVEGKPNWNTPPQMNKATPNELAVTLYVNSIENPEEHADVLPPNWKDYIIQPEPAAPGVIDGVTFSAEEATKVLDIVNNASRATLDDTIKLDSRAVDAIMAARPVETIEALVALSHVESRAATKLKEYLPNWNGVDA
jgi:hypothetical protein